MLNYTDSFSTVVVRGEELTEIGFDEELEYNCAYAVAFFLSMMLQDGANIEMYIGDEEGLYVTKGKIHFMHRVWEHEDKPCQEVTDEMLAEALL